MTTSTRRQSPSGPVTGLKTNVTVNHGASIAASTTTETTISCPGLKVNSAIAVSPRAAPAAGVAVSHGRCATADVLSIGLANLTTATVAAGTAVVYDIAATVEVR